MSEPVVSATPKNPGFPSHRTSKKYCKKCGMRVRGPNHEEGNEHLTRKAK